jgi:hypothetical protein
LTTETDTLAAVDSPAARAERERRAEKIFEGLSETEIVKLEKRFSTADRNYVTQAHQTPFQDNVASQWIAEANAEARRRFREVALKELVEQLRLIDAQRAEQDPDALEAERIWAAYLRAVSSVALRQGNKEDAFVKRWRELVADRAEAEAIDDAAGVRAAERRLDRHVGIAYPRLPDAAWSTAKVLPPAEREAEYRRLEAKYGPRTETKKSTRRSRAGTTA